MKKLFSILFILCGFIAGAQVYTPQTAAGYQYKRVKIDSTIHIPTFCGLPNLKSATPPKMAAIAFDSCNHKFYFYDPKRLAWDTIKGGGIAGITQAQLDDTASAIRSAITTTVRSNLTTDSIPEGNFNLYLTTERIREALSANLPILYDESTGTFSIDTSSATGVATKHDLQHIDTAVINVTGYLSGDTSIILVEKNGGATNKIKLLNAPETDPTVSPYIKTITSAFFDHGETAFSWGNHASAGYVITANNGLTKTGSNVQLGGNIIQQTDIYSNSNQVFFNSNIAANYYFNRVTAATSGSFNSLTLLANSSTGNSFSNGFGAGFTMGAKGPNNIVRSFGAIDMVRDVNDSSGRIRFFNFKDYNGSTGYSSSAEISRDGQWKFNRYGIGTFTGTPAYFLTVSSSGDVIETAPTSFVESDPVWTGVSSDYRTFTQNNLLYAPLSHTHPASDIISGILPIARGGTALGTIGTVGQSLRVAASGTALEYFTPAAGNAGTVTNVTATSPISITGVSTVTPNVTISQSSGSTNGYLSSTDWNVFNNKQAAGSYVNISDTAAMLSPYVRKIDSTLANRITVHTSSIATNTSNIAANTSAITLKVNISDTAAMLSPYLKSNTAAATYQPIGSYSTTANLALKVNISDTGTMLNPYLRKIDSTIANRVTVHTTSIATNTSNIATNTASILLKVNISDTSSMLSPYLRKIDSTIANRVTVNTTNIALKQNLITLTTTGTSGASTFNQSTGALNIPAYAAGVGTVTGGTIVWPGTIYSTTTTGAVTAGSLDFSPSLASQSAYTLFGRGASSGVPSFLSSIDSNWIPALHTQSYYNTKYASLTAPITLTTTGSSGAATLTGTVLNVPSYSGGSLTGSTGDLVSFSATNTQSNISPVATGSVLVSNGTAAKPVYSASPTLTTSLTVPTLIGSVSSGGTLALSSTSNATKGKITFGTSAYDEVNNRLGIGTASPFEKFQVNTDGATARGTFSTFSNTATDYSTLYLLKGKGTNASPLALASGDKIASLRFVGQLSSTVGDYNTAAFIEAVAAGAFSSTSSPAHLIFYTTPISTINPVERMRITENGSIGIGNSPNVSAVIDVASTTQGMLMPRLTTTQRDAIASPATGLLVFNTNRNIIDYYNGSAWVNSTAFGYVAATTNYTATSADYTIDCTSGTFTVTLPTAVGITGRSYIIKNKGSGTITLTGTSSQTFDGVTSLTILPGKIMVYESTGSNWTIINSVAPLAGSVSTTGTATTTFTVTIGATQANSTYKVNVTPTSTLAAAVFYVNNKTTTTFDVVYLAGLTGTVAFDWSLFP